MKLNIQELIYDLVFLFFLCKHIIVNIQLIQFSLKKCNIFKFEYQPP